MVMSLEAGTIECHLFDSASVFRELNRLELSAIAECTHRDNKATGSAIWQFHRAEVCATPENMIVKAVNTVSIEIHSVLKYNRFETTTGKVTTIIVIGSFYECIFTNYFQTLWQCN